MALLKELLKKIRGENEPDDYSEPPVSEPVEKPAEAPLLRPLNRCRR